MNIIYDPRTLAPHLLSSYSGHPIITPGSGGVLTHRKYFIPSFPSSINENKVINEPDAPSTVQVHEKVTESPELPRITELKKQSSVKQQPPVSFKPKKLTSGDIETLKRKYSEPNKKGKKVKKVQ